MHNNTLFLSNIPQLIHSIDLQASGSVFTSPHPAPLDLSCSPAEASRAIRKKIKHGNTHQQYRALVVRSPLLRHRDDHSLKAEPDRSSMHSWKIAGQNSMVRVFLLCLSLCFIRFLRSSHYRFFRRWTAHGCIEAPCYRPHDRSKSEEEGLGGSGFVE